MTTSMAHSIHFFSRSFADDSWLSCLFGRSLIVYGFSSFILLHLVQPWNWLPFVSLLLIQRQTSWNSLCISLSLKKNEKFHGTWIRFRKCDYYWTSHFLTSLMKNHFENWSWNIFARLPYRKMPAVCKKMKRNKYDPHSMLEVSKIDRHVPCNMCTIYLPSHKNK